MLERSRPRREFFGSPGGLDPILGQAVDHAQMAMVNSGVHTEPVPVAGMTVGEFRHRYADRFDIDPRSEAQIDGRDVSENTVVRAGQLLMFMYHAGEKGSRSSLLP